MDFSNALNYFLLSAPTLTNKDIAVNATLPFLQQVLFLPQGEV